MPLIKQNSTFKTGKNITKKFDMSLDWLIDNQCITEVSCQTSKTKPSKFYPLTEKGYDLLKTPKSKRNPTPKMFKHTFYCIKVEESLKDHGYDAKREWAPKEGLTNFNQSSTDITVPQRIDVFAIIDGAKTAYEITLSFSNLELNLYKCFGIMKMDYVTLVCENKAAIDRAKQKILKSKMPDKYEKRIEYVLISEFF